MKNKKKILITCILTIIISGILASYAYFSVVISNKDRALADLSTGTMRLRFADRDKTINKKVNLGETITKKFTIENTGTLEASISLNWEDLINTYTNESLTYELSYCIENCTSDEATYSTIISKTNVPVSSIPISTPIANELSVPENATYYYNLDITFNDLENVNQNKDVEASLSTKFNVCNSNKYWYYTLSINPEGGVWNEFSSTQIYKLKNNETMDIPNPTRTGHRFIGWEIDGISSELNGTTFSMGISNTTLRAKWEVEKYTITINKDGNEETRQVDYGATIDLGEPEEKEGYTFTSWDVTGGTLEGNILTIDSSENITATATYTPNNYKYIVYHNQMNTTGEGYTLVEADTDEGEATYGSTITPDRKTYNGFTSPAAKSLTIQVENAYPPIKNKVEYNYDRNKYDVTFNIDGTSTTEEMYYGSTKELAVPEKTGYDFTNWSVEDGTIDGNTLTITGSNTKVTANYTPKTFSVTFNPNGGVTETLSKTVTYDSTYEELPEPTYEGFTFLGWYTEQTGGTKITADEVVKITADQVIYAQWESNGTDDVSAEDIIAKLGITPKDSTTLDFAEPATTDEGVYTLEDDYGTSYFYRGAVTNNYVKFGKWADGTSNAGKDMYWRIIRINGDGSVRIRYDGTQAYANGTDTEDRFTHLEEKYAISYDDAKYVGWMYGPAGRIASKNKEEAQSNVESSYIKKVVDEWYKENMENQGYGEYIEDAIFCNDRSTPGKDITGSDSDTGLGYGKMVTAYGAYARLGVQSINYNNVHPTFKCPQKNDAFTVDDKEKGNGALTYPVGLITADEIIAAGSGRAEGKKNSSYYLYHPSTFSWSISPDMFDLVRARVFVVGNSNVYSLYFQDVENRYYGCTIAPVINLTAEFFKALQGDGSINKPFEIKQVNITLNSNGGYVSKEKKLGGYGISYGNLPEPARDGYIFLGWFTDKEGGKKIDANTKITTDEDHTLYAHWKESSIILANNSAAKKLIEKANGLNVTLYENGNKSEMFRFIQNETSQTESLIDYRFIGGNPNNYVKFNNETWRIIGVFPTENEKGILEQRLKLIKDKFLDDAARDTNNVNNWPNSSLEKYLNGDYYNSLSDTAKNQISNAEWYLGGNDKYEALGGIAYYNLERGNLSYSGHNKNTIRNIGLMYPSDYIFGYANSIDSTCFEDTANCTNTSSTKNWLYKSTSAYGTWTITSNSENSTGAFIIRPDGNINISNAVSSAKVAVRPVVYLKADIDILDGDGSSTNPYILSEP